MIALPSDLVSLHRVCLTLASMAGPVNILDQIHLTVRAGETLAITGPSGSGKTSLLMILGGIEQASAGTVMVAGQDISALSQDGLARWRRHAVGIVFQSFHLIGSMTAQENVMLPLELTGHADPRGQAMACLDRVGVGHRACHYPGQLSGGEQQRVALARAFAAEPPLILADEPTGNLDQATGHKVMDLLLDQRARTGATLILVTHDPHVANLCDRGLVMGDGRLAVDQHL